MKISSEDFNTTYPIVFVILICLGIIIILLFYDLGLSLVSLTVSIFVAVIIYLLNNRILNNINENVNIIVDFVQKPDFFKREKEKVVEAAKKKGINIIKEPKISGKIRPDYIIEKDEKKIPVEFKVYPKKVLANKLIQKIRYQMYEYMDAVQSDESYLLIFAPEITKKAISELEKPFYDNKIIHVNPMQGDFTKIDNFRVYAHNGDVTFQWDEI